MTADGWKNADTGYFVYAGPPADTVGMTREQVQQELAAFRKNFIAADDWMDVGDGGYFVFVGQPNVTGPRVRHQPT